VREVKTNNKIGQKCGVHPGYIGAARWSWKPSPLQSKIKNNRKKQRQSRPAA